MENNLKNRYIYAVTRHLPVKMQADVEKELDGLISDMLDERRGNNANSEQDIKDVLAELGAPEELALKYHGGEHRSLISGVYFLMYKRVLLLVLPIVAAVLAVLTSIGFLVGDESSLHVVFMVFDITFMAQTFQIIATSLGGAFQAFAVITIIFAILDYKKVSLRDGSMLADLPEIPDEKMKIAPAGPIAAIIFSISLTALFLGFPQMMALRHDNEWLPVFDIVAIRALWLPVLAWTLVEIIGEIVKLIEGRYTMRLAGITMITSILQVLCIIWVFGSGNIINPGFLEYMAGFAVDFEAFGWVLDNVLSQPNMMLMVSMLVILFFETLEIVVKAFRTKI